MRADNRQPHELRPITVRRHFTGSAAGSVLIQAGRTTVLCTASVEDTVPPWKQPRAGEVPTGWVTAEYSMLPGSTVPRKQRERNRIDSRSSEIQRLIGRSLRSVVDFAALGPRTITVDCDVLEADGGTRTLSITGGYIALADAVARLGSVGGFLRNPPTGFGETGLHSSRPILLDSVAAVSVGIVDGDVLLDLDYREDSRADVDLNVVMTGRGEFVELQGTAERRTFSRDQLDAQLALAADGIARLTALQRAVLADGNGAADIR
jgi:ribonuclease PH